MPHEHAIIFEQGYRGRLGITVGGIRKFCPGAIAGISAVNNEVLIIIGVKTKSDLTVFIGDELCVWGAARTLFDRLPE